jgi:hypothetical protein
MRNAKVLCIWYIEPRKRKWARHGITLLDGTARSWSNNLIDYSDRSHYVLIEHEGKVLFDSREVFPCDMQKFARDRKSYVARMAERGFSRESLNLDTPTYLP